MLRVTKLVRNFSSASQHFYSKNLYEVLGVPQHAEVKHIK